MFIVFGHHALYVKKPDEEERFWNLPPAKRPELLGLFPENRVVAWLGGHLHKLTVNDHHGIQLVNAEATCKNFDKRPPGFRLWRGGATTPLRHEFVPLVNSPEPDPGLVQTTRRTAEAASI